MGQLLAHAASDAPMAGATCREFAWRPEGGDLRQFQWALEGGLGPLLHRATRDCRELLPPAWRETLLACDLSARIRHGSLVDTLLEVLDACDRLGLQPTLLKGISISEQCYPAEHLRPMGDVDLLILAQDYERVESALLAGNFERVDQTASPGLQHGIPLRHSLNDCVVELHTGLFSSNSALRPGSLFGAASLAQHAVASTFHGRPARRLRAELQLAYVASSWFNDITTLKVHPSFLATLFDAVYLLRGERARMDFNALPAWLDNPMATTSLHLLATYLARHGVEPLPAAFLAHLASAQNLSGPLQRRLIHRMLDGHLLAGRPWPHRLPPPVPGRYHLRHQFLKRVLGRWPGES